MIVNLLRSFSLQRPRLTRASTGRPTANLRLLLVSYAYPPYGNGAEKQAKVLATALARRGIEVTVLTLRFGSEPSREVQDSVIIHRLPFLARLLIFGRKARWFTLLSLLAAYVAINRWRFDVLQAQLGDQFTCVAVGVAKSMGLPSVVRLAAGGELDDIRVLQGMPIGTLGPWLAPLLLRADRFVVLNERAAAGLPSQIDRARVDYIPNGIDLPTGEWRLNDLSARRRELGIAGEGPVLFAAGRLNSQKGFDVLIQALSFMRGIDLYLAGEGDDKEKLAFLAEQDRVNLRLLGKIPPRDVAIWMQAANAVVAPSHYEGMSNTILEAMALGSPIIATDIAGNVGLIDHNETGLLVRPGDARELAEAISRLLADPELATRIGTRARDVVRERFTVEAMRAQYEAVYARIRTIRRA